MKNYKITVNGNSYDVTVEDGVANSGSTYSAPIVNRVPTPVSNAVAANTATTASNTVANTSAPVQPVVSNAPSSAGSQGTIKITSPMPGKILKVNVTAGQSVKKGEALVILEAMKMENEIVAPEDGIVASVNVSVNGSVESGDVLATLN